MKIVVSGSMLFYNAMIECAKVLEGYNFNVTLPQEDKDLFYKDEYKKEASRLHFCKIADPSTDSILVLNKRKNGIDNYIGANTFAEVALAFYFNKKIFLLNDYYDIYKDELIAWGAKPLKGNLKSMISLINESGY